MAQPTGIVAAVSLVLRRCVDYWYAMESRLRAAAHEQRCYRIGCLAWHRKTVADYERGADKAVSRGLEGGDARPEDGPMAI
jgi:hypothetical protein